MYWRPVTGETETADRGCKQYYAIWKRNLGRKARNWKAGKPFCIGIENGCILRIAWHIVQYPSQSYYVISLQSLLATERMETYKAKSVGNHITGYFRENTIIKWQYLHRMDKAASLLLLLLLYEEGGVIDDAEHTVFECASRQSYRSVLTSIIGTITADNIG